MNKDEFIHFVVAIKIFQCYMCCVTRWMDFQIIDHSLQHVLLVCYYFAKWTFSFSNLAEVLVKVIRLLAHARHCTINSHNFEQRLMISRDNLFGWKMLFLLTFDSLKLVKRTNKNNMKNGFIRPVEYLPKTDNYSQLVERNHNDNEKYQEAVTVSIRFFFVSNIFVHHSLNQWHSHY